jgi:tetratricopeptide (TPR) repeat protein
MGLFIRVLLIVLASQHGQLFLSGGSSPAAEAASPAMEEGMRLLNRAIAAQAENKLPEMKSFLDQAISAAPRLSIAYTNRAQYYVMIGDFSKADRDFTRGLSLIFESDQPQFVLNVPIGGRIIRTEASASELAGDHYISHGYALIKLARHITSREKQKAMLVRAKAQINKGLAQQPAAESREMARELLKGFPR